MKQELPFLNLEDLKTINFAEKAVVASTEEETYLTVKDVMDKIGEDSEVPKLLRLLGEETVLCRLFMLKGEVYCGVPKIYRDEENVIGLYDAQNNPQPIKKQIEFIQYETDVTAQPDDTLIFTGHQVITITEEEFTVAFQVPVGIHKTWQEEILQAYKEDPSQVKMPKGKKTIPPQVINYYPRSLTPMSSLDVGTTLVVKENLGLDPRGKGATRFRVQKLNGDVPVGEVFEVWANRSLREHYKKYRNTPCTVISKKKKDDNFILKFGRADLAQVS